MPSNLGSRIKARIRQGRTRYRARQNWRARFAKIYALHPEYAHKVDASAESTHRLIWAPLQRKIHLDTLRVCTHISGFADPQIIPEEVYVTELEPRINRHKTTALLAHKSVYNRWFGDRIFPQVLLHAIDGQYFDPKYKKLHPTEVSHILQGVVFPVTIKPNVDSYGGTGVYFPKSHAELSMRMNSMEQYVLQEYIEQDKYFSKFNHHGLNTLRVCLYRSVLTNDMHILNVALRMGVGGSLDNETAGGIVCFVKEDGSLNTYAVDMYGRKFESHPDNGVVFADAEVIPQFNAMKTTATEVATGLLLPRIISLDLCFDSTGAWRVIEVNLFGQTIRFSQYAGQPFFGEFTDEVIEYCLKNPV